MKTFRYLGLSETGELLEGTLQAPDKAAAVEKARKICRVLTRIAPVPAYSIRQILHTDISQLLSGGKIPVKSLSLLCSQLAIGLRSGMPLVSCLLLTAKNQKDPFIRQLLENTAEDVRSGLSLADALETRNPQLPSVFIQTIRAGEETGTLADGFSRLADYYQRQSAVSSAVSSAMVYPAMLMIVAAGVIVTIMVFAVPVFEDSFARMGEALPLPTVIVIGISRFMTRHGFLLSALLICILAGLVMLPRTERGSRLYAALALTFPGIGAVNRMHAAAQLSTTLASMLHTGLPLLKALEITAQTLDNPLIGAALRQAAARLEEGVPLSQGLGKCTYLPSLLTELTAVGEETGSLAETLELVAEYYRGEVDTAVKRALSILEPCIILILAALVVWILLAVYLPIFSMYGSF